MSKVILTEHAEVNAKGKLNSGHTKMVICIDTGEVFSSSMDAAENANVHPSTMSLCCIGKTSTVKGKRYCYVKDLAKNLESLTNSLQSKVNMLDKYSYLIAEMEAEEQRVEAEKFAEQKRLEQLAREEEKRQQEEAKAEAKKLRHIASLERQCNCHRERYDKANARALAAQKAIIELEAEIKSLQCS